MAARNANPSIFFRQVAGALSLAIALAAVPTLSAGSIVFVDDDAPPGGDGSSWGSAYQFLQDALAFAADPAHRVAEIRVAQGLYLPDREGSPPGAFNRHATFELISGVALRGGYAGFAAPDPDERDIELYETILSGDLAGNDGLDDGFYENSYHVVTVASGGTGVLLEGFTVTAGNANGPPTDDDVGAGICNHGSIVLSQCRFRGNRASTGGSGLMNYQDVSVFDSVFDGNVATALANVGSARLERSVFSLNDGGGVYSFDDLTMVDCAFLGNTGGTGGAVSASRQVLALNCEFVENSGFQGGAMRIRVLFEPVSVVNCTFTDNTAAADADGRGGAVFMSGAAYTAPIVANCLFTGNTASAEGGGAWLGVVLSPPRVANCTFVQNAAESGGGLYAWGTVAVGNSIFWENSLQQLFQGPTGMIDARYCDVEGGWGGPGVISVNPAFERGTYRLAEGSPCIDAGQNWFVPRDLVDLDDDGDLDELVPFDHDGQPRFVNDPTAPDSGCGVPTIVDMGAFEYQVGAALPPVFGDLDGDQTVGPADLAVLLDAFGTSTACLADLNTDGVVNVLDLIELLLSFGAGPR